MDSATLTQNLCTLSTSIPTPPPHGGERLYFEPLPGGGEHLYLEPLPKWRKIGDIRRSWVQQLPITPAAPSASVQPDSQRHPITPAVPLARVLPDSPRPRPPQPQAPAIAPAQPDSSRPQTL